MSILYEKEGNDELKEKHKGLATRMFLRLPQPEPEATEEKAEGEGEKEEEKKDEPAEGEGEEEEKEPEPTPPIPKKGVMKETDVPGRPSSIPERTPSLNEIEEDKLKLDL